VGESGKTIMDCPKNTRQKNKNNNKGPSPHALKRSRVSGLVLFFSSFTSYFLEEKKGDRQHVICYTL
jgi:hypothetical protein